MIKKIMIAVIAVLFTAIAANANDVNVYPVQGVFPGRNINNPVFDKMIQNNKKILISDYTELFKKYFPNTVMSVDDKNKYKTFAAYVHVPRAGYYRAERMHGEVLDIYYPITVNLNFTNVLTGETLYSSHVTTGNAKATYGKNTSQDVINKDLLEQYKNNYKNHVATLLERASQEFKPFDIKTKITDSYKGAYILDKGLGAGLANGRLINQYNDIINIIYSAPDYSVAVKQIGNPKIGDDFIMFTTRQQVEDIKKPKILFINDFQDDNMYSMFSGALSKDAPFSLMTTDNSYYIMQRVIANLNKNFDEDTLNKKSMPDYFLKIFITKPAFAKYRTEVEHIDNDKFGVLACGVVFDRTGHVVYSKCAGDEIQQETKNEYRLAVENSFELNIKNALQTLANSMSTGIKFADIQFKIKDIDNANFSLSVIDTNGYLKRGNTLTVYKKVKTEKNGTEILVPAFDYSVKSVDKGVAICTLSKAYFDGADNPSKKDIVQIKAITNSANKADIFNYCPDTVEIEGNQIKLEDFNGIAFSAIASAAKSPIAIQPVDFQKALTRLESWGFKNTVEIPENNTDLTIKAMYKIVQKSEKFKLKGRIINRQYDIEAAVIAKKGDKIIKQNGAKQTVLVVLPRYKNDRILQYELLKNVSSLIQQAAAKF